MKLPQITAVFAAALALGAISPVQANNGKGNNHGQHANHGNHGPSAQSHGPGTNHAKRPKACPPGLAKKNTGCLPPGQWKKGDRLPDSWVGQFIGYNALPDFYRSRFGQNGSHRYLYRDGKVFVIDAATRTVLDIVLR